MNIPRLAPGFLALAAAILVAGPAWAQDPLKPPSPAPPKKADVESVVEFSFMVPTDLEVLDPVGLARFQGSLETLLHGTLDDAIVGTQPFIKGTFFFGVLLLDRTIAKMGHEYGHTAVFNRAGYQNFLLTVGNQDPEPMTFREVFINALIPQRHMAVQLEESDAQDARIRFNDQDYAEFNALAYAGGLNQEQVHLNFYRERVMRHEFGFFDTSSYLIESISTLVYTGSEVGDIAGYVDNLEDAGFSTSIAQVKALSLVRFLSGTAMSAGIGFYKAMSEDRFDGFAPRVLGKGKDWTVLWPEFESYLTRRGPTVRPSLPVRIAGALVIPGVEASFAGEGMEFEGGFEASRPMASWLDLRASFFAGTDGGTWGEVGAAIKPDPAVAFLLTWHAANGYTFRRDVHGQSFDFEEHTESGLHVGMSMKFRF